jgi:hypothetical protein
LIDGPPLAAHRFSLAWWARPGHVEPDDDPENTVMPRKGLIWILAMLLFPTAALAQWPRECRGDVSRLCRELSGGDDRQILVCLKDKEAKLSRGCRKLLQSYGHLAR